MTFDPYTPTSQHRKVFLKNVVEETLHSYLLKTKDGRFFAFWDQGLDCDYEIAVAEYYLNENDNDPSRLPVSDLSENIEEARQGAYEADMEMIFGSSFIEDVSDILEALNSRYAKATEKKLWLTKKHKKGFYRFEPGHLLAIAAHKAR